MQQTLPGGARQRMQTASSLQQPVASRALSSLQGRPQPFPLHSRGSATSHRQDGWRFTSSTMRVRTALVGNMGLGGDMEKPMWAPVPVPAQPPAESVAAAPAAEAPLQHMKLIPALQAIAAGLLLRFAVPIPAGITSQGWSLMAIFVSTVLGLVLDPLPVGAWAFLAMTACIATNTLSFEAAFAAMTNQVIWLIVVAFFFAKGIENTGLGARVANMFVKALGKSTLGLALGLNIAECLLAPAMPSSSARAGGIFVPIIKSLSEAAGSFPGDDSRKKMGAFLFHAQLQTSMHSSALFLTGAAQNLLCINIAAGLGAVVKDPFFTWTAGAFVPAMLGLILTPLLVYKMMPPTVTHTPEAPIQAEKRLEAMGPLSTREKVMLGSMGITLLLWVFGPAINCSSVLAAMIGLSMLLCAGVLSWKDCLANTAAWDTLVWFAALIGMSSQLNSMGVINGLVDGVGAWLLSLNLHWMPLFGVLHLAFFVSHYAFASQAAHVGALFSAFCTMMLVSGVPPVLATMSLAYSVNLFGSLSHYASGQAAAYYGSGFMNLDEIFSLGAINGFASLLMWGLVGMPIWKLLGWW